MSLRPASLVIPTIDVDEVVRIRPLRKQDLDAFDALHDDPDVWRAFGWEGPHNRGQNGQLLGALIKGESNIKDAYKIAFGIEDRSGKIPQLIGIVVLVVRNKVADVTVAIAPAARGRAIAPRVLAATFAWCQAEAVVDIIIGVAKPDNAASIRMMEKAGMVDQGEQEAENPVTGKQVKVREFHWQP